MTISKKRGEGVKKKSYIVDASAHFDAIMAVLRPELDRLEERNEVRFRHLSTKLVHALEKLDALSARPAPPPTATVIVQHEKCETDRERAERYEQKLYKFMGSTPVNPKTAHFLQGVLDHIEAQHFVSARQAEAVDRIIGEHYA